MSGIVKDLTALGIGGKWADVDWDAARAANLNARMIYSSEP